MTAIEETSRTQMAAQMNAMVYTRYGGPEVLHLEEVARPTPADGEVLVQVHASSANPADWHIMRGEPFLARLQMGLRRPKLAILGGDVAGRVESVGRGVTRFQPGDEVFGDLFGGQQFGGFAEYAVTSEASLVPKPSNVSFEEAAAVPLAGLTALQAVRERGAVQPGQRVLINGAAGGVGTFAVQLAKHFGAEVTGVCSTRNLELVRSIGAEHVIDYTEEDFTRDGQRYDVIVDAVGNRSASDYKRALGPGGICTIVGYTNVGRLFRHILLGPLSSLIGSRRIGLMGTVKPNAADLEFMRERLAAGDVVPVIDRSYPLNELPEAIGYLEEGHARGKVVIAVRAG